ncbi:MAG: AI-2E family transporter [Atopostipes suicloacalis]|nr:AI-2E family transporter [Atopostipes suicloacalis]
MEIQKNWRRILSLLLIVVLVYWSANNLELIQNLSSILISATFPFILGSGLAFAINIPMTLIEKLFFKMNKNKYFKKWIRALSITVSYILLFLLLFGLIFLVIPDFQDTITSFTRTVPEKITEIILNISNLIERNPDIVRFMQELDLNLEEIQQQAINYIQGFATNILTSSFNIISIMVSSIFTGFIAIVFSVYLLFMKNQIIRQMKKIVYSIWTIPWANYILNVGRKANYIFSSFVGGQTLEAFILAVLVYLGMSLFNFPYRLSVTVITGILSLIPVFGAILAGIAGFVLISVVSFPQGVWFAIFIVVLQQLESNLIYPRVVGSSVGLPGVWVMFAVTIGGSLFGLAGMLLGVPLVSLCYALISAQVNHELDKKGLKEKLNSNEI